MATFKDMLVEARNLLVNNPTVTATVAADKITFGAKPQTVTDPAIVLEAANTEYEPTFDSYAKAIDYRVAYRFYSESAVQLANMVDTMKDAVLLHDSTDFSFRIEDEGLTVDPDGDGVSFIVVRVTDTQGTVSNLIGSTGKTLGELVADHDANTTGLTTQQLVTFYENETGDPFIGPLDTLGLDDTPLAVSVRRLRGGYEGPCMRIRRISDNQHVDIGFDSNGDLDTAAIESFCAGTLGTVTTWYDQSGARNHLSEVDVAKQPVIYDNGAVITRNGKPAVIDRRIASSISSTLSNTTFGVGWRYAASGVFSLEPAFSDVGVAFTTMQYDINTDGYANRGWALAVTDGDTSSKNDNSLNDDARTFTNGVESHAYAVDPTRQELFDALSAGPTAIGISDVNNLAYNGLRLGYQSNFRMLDTQEFILIDNPSLTYYDGVDDAFYAALHGNQMAYFNIS